MQNRAGPLQSNPEKTAALHLGTPDRSRTSPPDQYLTLSTIASIDRNAQLGTHTVGCRDQIPGRQIQRPLDRKSAPKPPRPAIATGPERSVALAAGLI